MSNIWRWLAWGLLAPVLLAALGLQLSGHGYIWRALAATYLQGHATAHIDDANNFEQRLIAAGAAQDWPKTPRYNQQPLAPEMQAYLKQYGTAGFLVLQNGALLHEQYFAPYDQSSRTNAFSVAKTITTMQVGMAIQQGIIASFDSAITTELYFGKNARELVLGQGFEREPGSAYEYSSGSAQLLGVYLQRALEAKEKDLTISAHLSRSLWQPLGMLRDGIYTLDRDGAQGGIERTYCCIFATARDFAKFGQLLLQDGRWQGQTLLDPAFVERMRKPGLKPYYGHSLWLDWQYQHPFYLMQGHQGQYVIVVPSKQLVVVRLGQFRNKTDKGPNGIIPSEVYRFVDQAVALAQ